jgi:hypothetical protein
MKLPKPFKLAILLLTMLLARGGAHADEALPGKWLRRAPMPSQRSEVAAAEYSGKIFVFGGLEKNGERSE